MQIVPPRYLATQGRHPIIEALTPEINTWFGNSVTEPIPDELAAILRRMDLALEVREQPRRRLRNFRVSVRLDLENYLVERTLARSHYVCTSIRFCASQRSDLDSKQMQTFRCRLRPFSLIGEQHAHAECTIAGRVYHFAGFFVAIPVVSQYAFWIAIVAYVVLAAGCVMKGV